MSSKIGLILGSARPDGNGRGISEWFKAHFVAVAHSAAASTTLAVVEATHSSVLGPVRDHNMAALVRTPEAYASPHVAEWSRLVSSFAGVVILTPQHNWGYPADVKTLLDHLYWEWRGKEVMLVTYGGHGGGKCAAQLKQVLEGGLHTNPIKVHVGISLPEQYVSGNARVRPDRTPGNGADDDFLTAYDEPMRAALAEFLQQVQLHH